MEAQIKPVSANDAATSLEYVYLLSEQIAGLEQRVADMREERDRELSQIVRNGITEAGNYEVLTKPTIRRSVNTERFKEMFPEQYEYLRGLEIAKAKQAAGKTLYLKDAEMLLGKDVIAPALDVKTTLSYSVQKRFNDGTEAGI